MKKKSSEQLEPDEELLLTEVLNVAFGKAASYAAILLNTELTLHVPQIIMQRKDDSMKYGAFTLEDDELSLTGKSEDDFSTKMITRQGFSGRYAGEMLFITERSLLERLVPLYEKNGLYLSQEEALLDFNNMFSVSILTIIIQKLGLHAVMNEPYIDENFFVNIGSDNGVIIIDTVLDLRDHKFKGKFFIFTSRESFHILKNGLADILKTYEA